MVNKNCIIAIVLSTFLASTLATGLFFNDAKATTSSETVGPLFNLSFVYAYTNDDSAIVVVNVTRLCGYGEGSPTSLVDVYRINLLSNGAIIGTKGLAFLSNHNLPMSANGTTSIMRIILGIPAASSSVANGPEIIGESSIESFTITLDRPRGNNASVTIERLYSLVVDHGSTQRHDINQIVTQGILNKFKDYQITIHANGDITPVDAGIQRSGDLYTLVNDFCASLLILRNNIIVEGANHTLAGFGVRGSIALNLTAANVTIQNIKMENWEVGILGAWNNNTITNNTLIDNSQSIAVYGNDYVIRQNNISSSYTALFIVGGAIRPQGDNNLIIQNQISDNHLAFSIADSNGTTITRNDIINNSKILSQAVETWKNSSNTLLYFNNFINNTQHPSPFSPAAKWDNGTVGNYWSDYLTRYPNAAEIWNTGIGNTPYVVDEGREVDFYPLMKPFSESTDASNSLPTDSLFTIVSTVMVVIAVVAALAVAVLFVVRKIRRSQEQYLSVNY